MLGFLGQKEESHFCVSGASEQMESYGGEDWDVCKGTEWAGTEGLEGQMQRTAAQSHKCITLPPFSILIHTHLLQFTHSLISLKL